MVPSSVLCQCALYFLESCSVQGDATGEGKRQASRSSVTKLGAGKRYRQYLEHLKALGYGGAKCAVLRKGDEVKVERVGQITL